MTESGLASASARMHCAVLKALVENCAQFVGISQEIEMKEQRLYG